MKTAKLIQRAHLSSGVIGELTLGDLVLQTIETEKCLPEGEHYLKPKDGRFAIEVDGQDYFVLMDRNSQYRAKGLCVGYDWDFRSFDVVKKGDAMQDLLRLVGDKMKIVVTRPDTKLEDVVAGLEAQLETANETYHKDMEHKEAENNKVLDALLKELGEVKGALKWAIAQTSPGKVMPKAQAEQVIEKVKGESNESDRDDSSPSIPSGE